jgi:hypothetical protein
MRDTAHNEPHVLAIDLPDPSSSDQSIKLVSFHSGDGGSRPSWPRIAAIRESPRRRDLARETGKFLGSGHQ